MGTIAASAPPAEPRPEGAVLSLYFAKLKNALMGCSVLALAGMSFAYAVYGQAFDVVSVRPSSVQDFSGRSVQNLSGGIRFIGMPLSTIIMPAYQVWDFQISGPDWIRTEPWDIVAKTEAVQGFLKIDQMRPMLRALLEDRFRLKVHREKKLMSGYALVVDKRGPKLQANNGASRLIQDGRGPWSRKRRGCSGSRDGSPRRSAAWSPTKPGLGRNSISA
jgi:hypothetical protein